MKNFKCPIHNAAKIIGDVWVLLILRYLLKEKLGEARFCEIENSLEGISTRTLTIKLKLLEKEKMIEKRDYFYKLTSKGKSVSEIIKSMEKFGKKYSK